MRPYRYPVFLDVEDWRTVIVGGGAAAARRARGLLAAGAGRVCVVAPEMVSQMPGEIERIEELFHPRHLRDAKLVIAATDDSAVNEAVVAEARKIGALASRIDARAEDHGDFIVPALWRQGALSVAVSTGSAPLLAICVRDGIGQWIDPRWTAMADVMALIRPILTGADIAADRRREIQRALICDDALETSAQEGSAGLLKWLAGRYPDLGLPPAEIRPREEM